MFAAATTRTIAIDAMGGDLGPAEIAEGIAIALKDRDFDSHFDEIIAVGDESLLFPALRSAGISGDKRIEVHHASEVIGMDEKPLQSLKRKPDSSMVQALGLVRDGRASALLSCGNTGSLMAGGTLRIRPLEGVERPALGTIIPTRTNSFILLDAGANPEPSSLQMCQNAILGANYAKVAIGVEKPRVGLLTIGTEEGKGSTRIQESHKMLKKMSDILDYTGLIEGFQVFESKVDVVVCDGFTGNVVLKVCESLFRMLSGYVKEELSANWVRKAGAALSMGAYKTIKAKLNPAQYGGAPLLGLKAPVLKAHGSSDRDSIAGALKIAIHALQQDMTKHIREDIETASSLFDVEDDESLPPAEKELASS
ncbi:MAG: phosphate acyltransferase PlsX [Verrucomicrobiota bacterium]